MIQIVPTFINWCLIKSQLPEICVNYYVCPKQRASFSMNVITLLSILFTHRVDSPSNTSIATHWKKFQFP